MRALRRAFCYVFPVQLEAVQGSVSNATHAVDGVRALENAAKQRDRNRRRKATRERGTAAIQLLRRLADSTVNVEHHFPEDTDDPAKHFREAEERNLVVLADIRGAVEALE